MKKLLKQAMALLLTLSVSFNLATAQDAQDALNTLKQQVDTVLADIKQNKTTYQKNPEALNAMIDQKVLPYFDDVFMAKAVLGQAWNSATDTQRSEFINELKSLILRTYSMKLLDYSDAQVTYRQPEQIRKNRVKIDVLIKSGSETHALTLSMGYRDGKWLCYDVSLEGVSPVASFRSSINDEISQKGLAKVIDELKAKNEKGEVIKQ